MIPPCLDIDTYIVIKFIHTVNIDNMYRFEFQNLLPQPVDRSPWTCHIECVAEIVREE